MSFDARSRERLEALGRQLPRPLPLPTRGDAAGPAGATTPAARDPRVKDPRVTDPKDPRHRVETETDPEALFHELMQVSPDGTVPPHLLERLRQAEAGRQRQPGAAEPGQRPQPRSPANGAAPARRSPQGQRPLSPNRQPPASGAESDLYTAFQQMLLEDDDLA